MFIISCTDIPAHLVLMVIENVDEYKFLFLTWKIVDSNNGDDWNENVSTSRELIAVTHKYVLLLLLLDICNVLHSFCYP